VKDSVIFETALTHKNDEDCNRNAHLLAYFAVSGKEMPRLIKKYNPERK